MPVSRLARALVLAAAFPAATHAQAPRQQGGPNAANKAILASEGYVRPPAVIEKMILAPREQALVLRDPSPDGAYMMDSLRGPIASVQTFGRPHYNLGGLQVDWQANRNRTLTNRGALKLRVVETSNGTVHEISAPANATLSSPKWSPDGKHIAYFVNTPSATHIYVADVAGWKSRQVSSTPVLATLVQDLDWTADGRYVVTVVLPEGRGAEPARPAIETGPVVRMVTPATKQHTPTYPDLLESPYEKQLLTYYSTGQLARIEVASRNMQRIGRPAMISGVEPSPDGQWFRVTTVLEPFSYVLPQSAFGSREELWDATGKVVSVISNRPMREGADSSAGRGPAAAADTARRNFQWMSNGSISFMQQEPAPRRAGADSSAAPDSAAAPARGGAGAPRRMDRLYSLAAPFTGAPTVLHESNARMSGAAFTADGKGAIIAENNAGTGALYAVYFAEPGKRYPMLRQRGWTANVGGGGGFGGGGGGGGGAGAADSLTFYTNPGSLMTRRGASGATEAVTTADGRFAFIKGTRYFKTWMDSTPQPFVDRIEIRTGTKTRRFQSPSSAFDEPVALLGDDASKLLVRHESGKDVPNYRLVDDAAGKSVDLTHNTDPTPEFAALQRKRILVTRADGIKFWVKLTLPADYKAGTRLPGMFWFYPYEYTDQAGYDRSVRTENVNRYPVVAPRTIEQLATQGYAVANFDPPVIGVAGRMNDNYVPDLRNNLSAVIDELDAQGFIDRKRLGIGGHSYGAFSTVNAMVNTPYFKAGIAGDGNYNRSLTPNGFQSERRDLWDARETYLAMSPFLYADRLQGALLMYHSLEDQNTGTDPSNSIRLMHALTGMGKTAALYMYPYEDHGPLTKETILDQWGRWTAWLDTYVKNAGASDAKALP